MKTAVAIAYALRACSANGTSEADRKKSGKDGNMAIARESLTLISSAGDRTAVVPPQSSVP